MKALSLKNYLTALTFSLSAFAFTACDNDVLRPHGDDVSITRTVGAFDEIEMGGEFEVYLTQGPAEDLRLEGPENVIADLKTTTRNHKLEIEFRSRRVKLKDPVRVYITTPELTSLDISGANTVKGVTDWNVKDLDIKTSGSGEIDLVVRGADSVFSRVSGSGEVMLKGDAHRHDLDISGSGKLKAFKLQTNISDVKISGSGTAEVTVLEKLKANISGSGSVYYYGNPAVETNISGSGKVRKAD